MTAKEKPTGMQFSKETNRLLLALSHHDKRQRHLVTTSKENFLVYMLHQYMERHNLTNAELKRLGLL